MYQLLENMGFRQFFQNLYYIVHMVNLHKDALSKYHVQVLQNFCFLFVVTIHEQVHVKQ